MDTAYEYGAVPAACHARWCQHTSIASLQLFQGTAMAHGVEVQVAGALAGSCNENNNSNNPNLNYDMKNR